MGRTTAKSGREDHAGYRSLGRSWSSLPEAGRAGSSAWWATENFRMPSDTPSVELVAELHRRQGEMHAGESVAAVVELLAGDIVWTRGTHG